MPWWADVLIAVGCTAAFAVIIGLAAFAWFASSIFKGF